MNSNLDRWLQHIEQLNPRTMDLDLARVRRVHGAMGLPRRASPVVTVAGTNGKGSCVAWLESILRAAGLRTATYTSPHLQRYNERVCIDAKPVSDEQLVDSFDRIESVRGDTRLTYFEFGTLAALALFEEANVDIRLLEVGLGGRLDAVNVIDADVAIITSIGLDHCDWLGSDRSAIGREKAGIFRSQAPAIVGERELPDSVSEVALARGARLLRIGRDFDFELTASDTWAWTGCLTRWSGLPRVKLGGREQYANASCALAALEQLAVKVSFGRADIVAGLNNIELAGRFQVLELAQTWVLDVAHNREAAVALADSLRHRPVSGRTLVVAGLMQDKPVEAFGAALDTVASEWWAVAADSPRALSAEDCARRLQSGVASPVHLAGPVGKGLRLAAAAAGTGDRILVTGSFLIVGAALDYLSQHA